MFVPPYASILASLGTDPARVKKEGTVEVPREFLDMLLRCLLYLEEFDEKAYLEANPDVKAAVRTGEVKSGRSHYVGFGYFEGRQADPIQVNEAWYLKTYPDVAMAVKRGEVASGAEHYALAGIHEWRAPNRDLESEVKMWKQALKGTVNA
jgi:hypothetical protein